MKANINISLWGVFSSGQQREWWVGQSDVANPGKLRPNSRRVGDRFPLKSWSPRFSPKKYREEGWPLAEDQIASQMKKSLGPRRKGCIPTCPHPKPKV
ncbi:MAG: hypothetical protein CM15mP74_27320 [Halieaceae bacterium]|nr:MAG: hypothetical protein CM15mP74_27320 [Halieaceae bacterium]